MLKTILSITTFIILNLSLFSQTTYRYTLDAATVEIAPTPTQQNGIYPAPDYSSVSKPLLAQPYAFNEQFVADAATIHTEASGKNTVFFGGDNPASHGYGAVITPIFTTQTFSESDFPIQVETKVFNLASNFLYNESWIHLIDANHELYGGIEYNETSSNANNVESEGIAIGGLPGTSYVFDKGTRTDLYTTLAQKSNTLASYSNWYDLTVIINFVDGKIVVEHLIINGNSVFDNPIEVDPVSWSNNFRIGIGIDDLAQDFIITTNAKAYNFDPDGDCLANETDNCPDITNKTQSDTDQDGVGNACDNCPDEANADQADANGNGIGDACEAEHGGSSFGLTLSDGDVIVSNKYRGLVLTSPNGNCFRVRVTDDGILKTVPVDCREGNGFQAPKAPVEQVTDTETKPTTNKLAPTNSNLSDMEEVVTLQEEKISALERQLASINEQLETFQDGLKDAKNHQVLTLNRQASLEQNLPNPFQQNTLVNYFVPESVHKAEIRVTSIDGKVLGTIPVAQKGSGQLTIKVNDYPAAVYYYSLVLDGKVFETKKMVLTK